MAIALDFYNTEVYAFAEKWLKHLANDVGIQSTLYLGQDCKKLGFVCDGGIAMNALYPGIMSDIDVLSAAINNIQYISLLGNAIYSQWKHCISSEEGVFFNRKWFIPILERMKHISNSSITPPNRTIIKMMDDLRGQPVQNDLQKFLPNKLTLPEVKKMLKKGFDANTRDEFGRTPLMYCAYSSENYVKTLIEYGADCSAVDNNGNSVLMYLCDSFDLRSFDLVLKRGADINIKNKQGYSVLDFAMMQNISITSFLDRDAKIFRIIPEKLPAIVAREALNDDRIWKKLLRDKVILSTDFIYAMLFAFPDKWCDFMVKLSQHKLPKFDWEKLKYKLNNPEVTDAIITGLASHLEEKDLSFLLSLTEHYPISLNDSRYCDLLNMTIGLKYYKSLQLLLKRFGNPDGGVVLKDNKFVFEFSNKEAFSPLMVAVLQKNLTAAKILLCYGANANTGDTEGSAIVCAVRNNQLAMLKLLLECRADPNFALFPDQLPLKVAERYNRKKMIILLKQNGAVSEDESDEKIDTINTVIIPEFVIAGTFAVAQRGDLYSIVHGTRLRLFREHNNDYDKNAIRIEDEHSQKLGYIPRGLAKRLAPMIDEGTSLWGKVINVAKGKIEITALIYQRKIIPLNEMTSFTLTILDGRQTSSSTLYKYLLSVNKRNFKCDITRQGIDIRHIEVIFDKDVWQNVLDNVQKCNFLAWKKNYNLFPWDTQEWNLTVRFKNGKKFCTSGTTLYPEEWYILHQFINDSLNQFTVKGKGVFYTEYIKK